MDEASSAAIKKIYGKLYRELHDRLREQVRGLDRGTLNWRPLPKANSVAILVVHTLGAEKDMIRAVRRLESDRDRDSEFKAEADAEELLRMLDEADRDLEEHLEDLTPSDLMDDRMRKDHDMIKPGLEWMVSNYGHAREHLAQIELTKQLYDSRT